MQHLIKLDRAIDITVDQLKSLVDWQSQTTELALNTLNSGIVINENESVIAANLDLEKVDIIAFNFSKFADGRAFSEARTLRDTLNYKGDIRAMGEFIPDQVAFLTRCGFSSFACRTEEEKNISLDICGIVSNHYQADSIENRPSFRR